MLCKTFELLLILLSPEKKHKSMVIIKCSYNAQLASAMIYKKLPMLS